MLQALWAWRLLEQEISVLAQFMSFMRRINQNTGFNVVPAITTAAQMIMSLSGTLTNTSASIMLNNALTLNSGIIDANFSKHH